MRLLLLGFLLLPLVSFADNASLNVQSQKGSDALSGLKLEPKVTVEEKAYRIYGTFKLEGWQLIVDRKTPVELDEKLRFEILHPKDSPNGLEFELTAISPTGKVKSNIIQIQVQRTVLLDDGEVAGRYTFKAGLSLTSVSYSQSDSQTLYQLTPSLKGSARYVLVPHQWDLGVSGYTTTLPLISSTSAGALLFYGLNARAGYRLILPEYPEWVFTFSGGLYVLSTIGRTDIGYSGVFGPQAFPSAQYTFSTGEKLVGYLKFSPVATAVSELRFDSNEFAFGFDFTPVAPKEGFFAQYPISYALDFSFLSLKTGNLSASSHTVGAGATIAF